MPKGAAGRGSTPSAKAFRCDEPLRGVELIVAKTSLRYSKTCPLDTTTRKMHKFMLQKTHHPFDPRSPY